jgi:hypothetical protein
MAAGILCRHVEKVECKCLRFVFQGVATAGVIAPIIVVIPSAQHGESFSEGGVVRAGVLSFVAGGNPLGIDLLGLIRSGLGAPIGIYVVSAPDPEVRLICGNDGPQRLGQFIAITRTESDAVEALAEILWEMSLKWLDIDNSQKEIETDSHE